jgi:hypothetical protein
MSSNLTPSKWTGVARCHAQVDFGEAIGVIGGVRRELHVFFMSLPHSDAWFMKAYRIGVSLLSGGSGRLSPALIRRLRQTVITHIPP